MRLTRITKQEKRDRYNLFAEEDTFVGAVSALVLAQSGLREGDAVEPGRLAELMAEDEYGKALAKAYDLISRRLHTRAELKRKLERKLYDPALIEEVLDHLAELGYLDDLEFARRWVAERGGQRGARLLTAELRRKGVADEAVREVLTGHQESSDAVAAAESLARKRLPRLLGTPPRQAEAKLTRYLAGRGYDFETIRQAIGRLGL